jgi:hypothetical protein
LLFVSQGRKIAGDPHFHLIRHRHGLPNETVAREEEDKTKENFLSLEMSLTEGQKKL